MSDSLNRLERWEKRLKAVFDEINDELESTYGNNKRFRRHPNRLLFSPKADDVEEK